MYDCKAVFSFMGIIKSMTDYIFSMFARRFSVCFKILVPKMNDFMHWLLFSSPTYVRDKNYKVMS